MDWKDLQAAARKTSFIHRATPCFAHNGVSIHQKTASKPVKAEACLSKAATIGKLVKIQDLRLKVSLVRNSDISAHAELPCINEFH